MMKKSKSKNGDKKHDYPTFDAKNPSGKKQQKKSQSKNELKFKTDEKLFDKSEKSMLGNIIGFGAPVVMQAWNMFGYGGSTGSLNQESTSKQSKGKPPRDPKRKSKSERRDSKSKKRSKSVKKRSKSKKRAKSSDKNSHLKPSDSPLRRAKTDPKAEAPSSGQSANLDKPAAKRASTLAKRGSKKPTAKRSSTVAKRSAKPALKKGGTMPKRGKPSSKRSSKRASPVSTLAPISEKPQAQRRKSRNSGNAARPPRCKTQVSKDSVCKKHSIQSDSAMPKVVRTLEQICKEPEHSRVHFKDVKKGRKIGQGAFGSVFEATHKRDGSKLAVKEIWLGGKSTERLLTNTKREIDLLAKLEHKHIVNYLGCHKASDNFSMYLELVTGGALEDKIYPQGNRRKLGLRMAQDYGRQILKGLEYLHGAGVVHRDLKPANVLIDNIGIIKLADFGASFDIGAMTHGVSCQTTIGTPHYMAPEVIIRSKHTTASDVWSFGVMMFEMATGHLPFESKSAPQLMCQLAQGKVEVEWPKEMLPDNLRKLVEQCLDPNPRKRPSPKKLLRHPFFINKITNQDMSMSHWTGTGEEASFAPSIASTMLMTEYSFDGGDFDGYD